MGFRFGGKPAAIVTMLIVSFMLLVTAGGLYSELSHKLNDNPVAAEALIKGTRLTGTGKDARCETTLKYTAAGKGYEGVIVQKSCLGFTGDTVSRPRQTRLVMVGGDEPV